MSAPARTCPWPGCGRSIRREHFLCRIHWGGLPLEHRIAVNVAWQRGDALALIAAQDAALDRARARTRRTTT